MLVVVGLGNPGSEYAATRHNAGFAVVDALAESLGLRLRTTGVLRLAAGRRLGTVIVLAQPLTYMNNSGEAVAPLLREQGAAPGELIVCCDDLHLPLGHLRLRKAGSDGGHNGLRSLIRDLGTDAFPRLRCGIRGTTAPRPGEATAGYVLSPFESEEFPAVRAMVRDAAEAVRTAAGAGIDRAMNIVNVTRPGGDAGGGDRGSTT